MLYAGQILRSSNMATANPSCVETCRLEILAANLHLLGISHLVLFDYRMVILANNIIMIKYQKKCISFTQLQKLSAITILQVVWLVICSKHTQLYTWTPRDSMGFVRWAVPTRRLPEQLSASYTEAAAGAGADVTWRAKCFGNAPLVAIGVMRLWPFNSFKMF